MTLSAEELGASELLQRVRHRLVETEIQLRSLRNLGWHPEQLRALNEDIGRLHSAAERVHPAAAHAVQPLLHSLRDALAAPSMPSANQTAQMLALAGDALAALPLNAETGEAGLPATPATPAADDATADPFRVLIVEDDRSQAMFAEAILRGAGMQTDVVTTPDQMLAAMEHFAPDLVLMDLHMPGISGTALTMQIREHQRFAHMPVVFLTGDQDPERQLEVLEHGADDFILKPVRPRHLIAAVQSRVRRARAAAAQSRQAVAEQPERHPVTGLYTRPVLMQTLAALVPERAGAALLMEVGNAIALRNRYGYAGFEKLMNDVGRHLGELTREHVAARLSDNAFLVVVSELTATQLGAYARSLRDGIGYHDFDAGVESLRLRSTVGIADFVHDFADAGAALAAAEDAARDARAQPAGVAFYEAPVVQAGSGGIVDVIRSALDGEGLQLAFQPVVAVAGGDQAQFQVLLRLLDAQGTERLAGEFLPAAESAGLLPRLDRWAMEQALALLQRRRAQGKPVRLFVSQSPRTLAQDGYAGWLAQALEAASIDGTSLVIDLRLDDALVHSMLLRQFCEQLVPAGVQFCLSQYRHSGDADLLLEQLPLGYLRLSAEFARQPLPPEVRDEMRTVIERAHRLGLQVVGQAVEDPQAAAALWMGGIDFIQGNLVQRAEHALDFDFQNATL